MRARIVFLSRALLAAVPVAALVSCSSSIPGSRAVSADGRTVHRADQLDDFVLEAPVGIRGLGPEEALEKLDRAYRDACRKAGEVPLQLSYEVPPGYGKPLDFTTGHSFGRAVREVAVSSKLELSRRGTTYRFRPLDAPGESRRPVEKTYQVPPDFLARMSRGDQRVPIRSAIEKRGVSLHESTTLTFQPSNATLRVETSDSSDDATISALIQSTLQGTPRQIRWEVRTFETPPGKGWNGPADGVIDGAGLADLRRLPGVRERVISDGGVFSLEPLRSGESRRDRLAGGGSLRSEARMLAFGIHATADLREKNRERLSLKGQTPDGGTRISTTTRPDGSSIVLAVTPTIVDATGRPVKR